MIGWFFQATMSPDSWTRLGRDDGTALLGEDSTRQIRQANDTRVVCHVAPAVLPDACATDGVSERLPG